MAGMIGYLRRHHLGLLVLIVVLTGTSYAAVNAAKSTEVKACVKKRSGAVRVVKARSDCDKREQYLKWNRKGPAGRQGLAGPQGPAGADGAAGAPASIGAWHVVGAAGEPGFGAGWSQVTGANQGLVAFRKDSNGQVFLSGWATYTGLWTNAPALFTLPAGYAPSRLLWVPIIGQANANQKFVVITPDGNVEPAGENGQGFAVLDGASFFTDGP